MKPLLILLTLAMVAGCGKEPAKSYQPSFVEYDVLMDLAEMHGLTFTGKMRVTDKGEVVQLYRSAVCK